MSGSTAPNEHPETCPNEVNLDFGEAMIANMDTAITSAKITFLLDSIRYFTERLNDLTQHKYSQYLNPDVVQTITLLIASYQLGGINSVLATSMISLVLKNSEYLTGIEKMLTGAGSGTMFGVSPAKASIFSASSTLFCGLFGTVAAKACSSFASNTISALGLCPKLETSSDHEKALNRP